MQLARFLITRKLALSPMDNRVVFPAVLTMLTQAEYFVDFKHNIYKMDIEL